MDLLGLTGSKIQHWGSSCKGIKGIWGGTDLSGIRTKAGKAAFSETKVMAEAIVSGLSPSVTEPAVMCHV